jgi:hypothetical protein
MKKFAEYITLITFIYNVASGIERRNEYFDIKRDLYIINQKINKNNRNN